MRMHVRRTTTGLALAAAVALALTACGGSSNTAGSTTSSSSAAAPSTASSPASEAGTPVNVTEKEFAITLPKTTFAAGAYTFKVTNEGKFPHNFTIEGPGVDKKASPTRQGGQSGEVTVTLQKGSYEIFCSVDGHKGKGMDMKITVT
jgi:uncharacterized cupredoxin-like copper-binding protein